MKMIHVNEQNFEREVKQASSPVLVDFWAAWCGPCRMLSPVVDQISEEMENVKVCKVNVDENPQLAMEYGIMSIPSLLVFRDGKVVNQAVGVQPRAVIEDMLKD